MHLFNFSFFLFRLAFPSFKTYLINLPIIADGKELVARLNFSANNSSILSIIRGSCMLRSVRLFSIICMEEKNSN